MIPAITHLATNLLAVVPNTHGIKSDYGFFHVYAFTMTIGMIVSIVACYFKMRAKNIPIEPLIWSIFFIIPAALFGGSFFGKFNGIAIGINADYMTWYECFEFWKAGMSIHGGVLFGVIVGIIFFAFVARKYDISMWAYADAIIPNILLGQIIGRWGNFFNHELLGDPVSYQSLMWLPAFIRDNCFSMDEFISNGQTDIVYRAPIFLYESFWNFWAWVAITFIIPNIGKWSQRSVYKKHDYHFTLRVKYWFQPKSFTTAPISYREVWNQEYYGIRPTLKDLAPYEAENAETDRHWYYLWANPASRRLTKIYNPNKSWITYSGVEMGAYFFFWNFIRFLMEIQRSAGKDLFIMNDRPLDYAIIWLIAAFGIAVALIAQFVIPRFYRSVGYQYEKEYYDTHNPITWDLKGLIKSNIVAGLNNNNAVIRKLLIEDVERIIDRPGEFEKYFVLDMSSQTGETLQFGAKISPTALATKELNIDEQVVLDLDYRINLRAVLKNQVIGRKTITGDVFTVSEQVAVINGLLSEPNSVNYMQRFLSKRIKGIKAESGLLKPHSETFITFKDYQVQSQTNQQLMISKFSVQDNPLFYTKKGFHLKIK